MQISRMFQRILQMLEKFAKDLGNCCLLEIVLLFLIFWRPMFEVFILADLDLQTQRVSECSECDGICHLMQV